MCQHALIFCCREIGTVITNFDMLPVETNN